MMFTPECCPLPAAGRAALNAAAAFLMGRRPADLPEAILAMWVRTAIYDHTVVVDDVPTTDMARASDYVARGIASWEASAPRRAAVLAARGY